MDDARWDPQRFQAEERLREQLREDLSRFLDADVHTATFLVAYISRQLPLAELERLVDEMDGVFRSDGRSILDRRRLNTGEIRDTL